MSYVNPVLALPSMLEACTKAERSWKQRKGPMAAYWRSVSVYSGHIARALR